ncbi:MAG: hypothetical protein AAGC46_18225, partial [Solirubrobacteraceae bacterium]
PAGAAPVAPAPPPPAGPYVPPAAAPYDAAPVAPYAPQHGAPYAPGSAAPYAPAPASPYDAPPAPTYPATTAPYPGAVVPADPYAQPAHTPPQHQPLPAGGYSTPPVDLPGGPTSRISRPVSGWNVPAVGMLILFLIALGAVLWPQYRARSTEHEVKPLVVGLVGHEAWARCPRYITSVFTYVGAVTMDGKGKLSDHTELTGPICKGLRHLYTPAGRAEMACLVTTGDCSQTALDSVVALSTITHESMHLRGVLDEGQAECTSVAAAVQAAKLAGLTENEGRMIGYLHLLGMNPDTPPQYHLTPTNCPSAIDTVRNAPGDDAVKEHLISEVARTWRDIAT